MIPFNIPYLTGLELNNISNVLSSKHLAGDGPYTKLCSKWLEDNLNVQKALLTHSCTAALEMCAILLDLKPGDEVIMPSFTFVSTANAFVLRGAIPVFVDIRADTKNIDENLIESAVTSKTKAIVVVHYAGVACEMDSIMNIANNYNLVVVEDAAQAILSEYKGQKLGSIGHLACLSFHETKNIQCGEGGALLINDPKFIERAEIVREKGTNRSQFFRGQVNKYTWYDLGSSFLPSEITAAFLYGQLENAMKITEIKVEVWEKYYSYFKNNGLENLIPVVPEMVKHNGHFFYIVLDSIEFRSKIISELMKHGITTTFHYIPLHSSIAGNKFSRFGGLMLNTDNISDTLLRLPVYPQIDIQYILKKLDEVIENNF